MQRKARRPFFAGAAAKPKPAAIDRARRHHLSTIEKFRVLTGEANAFVEKAQRLLTTHWAHATWASRAEILKSVDWLLRVATSAPDPRRHGTPAE